jgi:hypothetical protein
MIDTATDPRRIAVWQSMADHFLDTETRHDIPWTALRCLDAGLSVAEARDVWRYEVSRAVGFNGWDVAGEWVGWDRDWLVERIDRLRRRWDNTAGTARWLRYRIRVHLLHGVWVSIGRCMAVLMRHGDRAERVQAASDLAWLARHYFDFRPDDLAALRNDERARLGALYPEPVLHALEPAVLSGERLPGHRRVVAALSRARR